MHVVNDRISKLPTKLSISGVVFVDMVITAIQIRDITCPDQSLNSVVKIHCLTLRVGIDHEERKLT